MCNYLNIIISLLSHLDKRYYPSFENVRMLLCVRRIWSWRTFRKSWNVFNIFMFQIFFFSDKPLYCSPLSKTNLNNFTQDALCHGLITLKEKIFLNSISVLTSLLRRVWIVDWTIGIRDFLYFTWTRGPNA